MGFLLNNAALKYLFAIFIFASNVQAQEWQWQNPKPTGNKLRDVKFFNPSFGIILTNSADYLKTTDGGKTWFSQTVQPIAKSSSFLLDIFFVDSLNGYSSTFGEFPVIMKTTNGGELWTSTTSPPTDFSGQNIESIYFTNTLNGYAASDHEIFHTSDGGLSWVNQTGILDFNPHIWKLCFLDSSIGFAAGGMLLRTENGGRSWIKDTTIELGIFNDLKSIFFIDKHNGWITSDFVVFRTTNSGKSWQKYSLIFEGDFERKNQIVYKINFFDKAKGWLSTSLGLFSTADSGKSWVKINRNYGFKGVAFIDGLNGFGGGGKIAPSTGLPGQTNKFLRTSDGGNTWQRIDTSVTEESLESISFADTSRGWCVGNNGIILSTTNGGNSWAVQKSLSNSWLRSVSFINQKEGWACGSKGTIIHTTNGGTDWLKTELSPLCIFESIHFTDKNNGWAAGEIDTITGDRGIAFRTTDGGKTWLDKTPYKCGLIYGVFFTNPKDGYLITGYSVPSYISGLYKTTDGGDTWTVSNLAVASSYSGITFSDPMHGWIVSGGKIHKTTDGGNSWKECYYSAEDSFSDISFSDSLSGIACGLRGAIISTSDGGNTWTKQYRRAAYSLRECKILKNGNSWAVGSTGTILFSANNNNVTNVIQNNHAGNFSRLCHQNYPNPFNPSTTISYSIPKQSHVELKVYDVLGREVSTIVNREQPAGEHKVLFDGSSLPSGVYIYTIQAGQFRDSKKLLLLK